MCEFFSAAVIPGNQLLYLPSTDSHSITMFHYSYQYPYLRDLKDRPNFVKIEFKFQNDPFNPEDYRLTIDQDYVPSWFDKDEVTLKCKRIIKSMIITEDRECLATGRYLLKDCAIRFVCGDTKIERMSGSAQIKQMSDSAQIKQMYGSAQIERMYDSAKIEQMSGFAQIERMSGSAQIKQMSDSAKIEQMYGSAQIEQMYGSAQIEQMSGFAQIKRMYDSAKIERMYDSARIIENNR
jgi:hypothetical protein